MTASNISHWERVYTFQDPLGKVIEVLVTILLAFLPLSFGAVEAWSEQIVFALVTLVCLCVLVRRMTVSEATYVRTWVFGPLMLVLVLAVFQFIELPTAWLQRIAPHTVALKRQYLADVPNASTVLQKMSLSFYTQGTIHDLRILLALVGVFFVIVNSYRSKARIKRLLTSIALIGGGFAVLAILQVVSQADKIYWIVEVPHGVANAGPFVNHSHFSQFMNLSMGAALARLFIEIYEHFPGKTTPRAAEILDYLRSPHSRMMWVMVAVLILGMVSVFVSLSRGGGISLLVACAFTMIVLTFQRKATVNAKILAWIAIAGLVLVLYVGFDVVYDRFATLQDLDRAEGGRWQIVQDITSAWKRFPWFGTGLGTHAVVYPMFDRSAISSLAFYAENEYAQALEETGLLGVTFLALCILGVWRAYWKNIRSESSFNRAVGLGLGYGILAIMVHSLSDFGQHMPANATLTMISSGLLITLAHRTANTRSTSRHPSAGFQHARGLALGIPLGAVVLAIGVWVLMGANQARIAEAYWRSAKATERHLTENNWQGMDSEYLDLLTHATKAAEHQPKNIEYQHWLNVFRWRSISRYTDPNTGDILIYPETPGFTRQIIDELNEARVHCPSYGQALSFIGELEHIVLNDPNGARHVFQAYELAPCDPGVCFMAATMHAELGEKQQAFEKLYRTVELAGRFFRDAACMCVYQLNDPHLALTLAGDKIHRLSQVAQILSEADQDSDMVQEIRLAIREKLVIASQEKDAPASVVASLAALQGRDGETDSAIANYQKALFLDYRQVPWRLSLAKLLQQKRRYDEAIHEARICLRLRPHYKPAERLIGDLSIAQTTNSIEAQSPKGPK